ncbi:T9SS type A sorting domain-containing protein [Reichenbachiella versicolor]|uniref:T9SS type A sorting domain-containing protein n=1 Tax=Reichenbachiella versicolor TaxID=1821036 RepID=UPI000D6E7551|nr:T9SS type A sorting domain-containing protein [Reichenbachiella versicolor]
MKLKHIIVALILIGQCTLSYSQNLEEYYQLLEQIDDSRVKTGVLFNKGFVLSTPQHINDFPGYFSDGIGHYALKEKVIRSIIDASKANFQTAPATSVVSGDEGTCALELLLYKGDYIENEELSKFYDDNSYKPTLTQSTILSLAPKQSEVNSLEVDFILESDDILSNIYEKEDFMEVDFGDGKGYRSIQVNQPIKQQYMSEGEKAISFRLILPSDTLYTNSMIVVKDVSAIRSDLTNSASNGRVVNMNEFSNADANVRVLSGRNTIYSDGDEFDKPVLFVEGFNVGGFAEKNLDKHVETWNGPLFSELRNHGYDIVIVDFKNNNQPLVSNAQVIKDLIKRINQEKSGNYSGVIIGQSMGGLVSRIALAELEQEGYDHQLRLYVSFDSPHKGANVPMGLQTTLDNIQDIDLVEFVEAVLRLRLFMPIGVTLNLGTVVGVGNDLNNINGARASWHSAAAKSMLRKHISFGSNNPRYNELMSHLQNVGYPSISRNVAMINGSSNGIGLGFSPGDHMVDYYKGNKQGPFGAQPGIFCSNWTKLNVDIWSTSINQANQKVSQVTIDINCVETTDKKGYTSAQDPLAREDVPGGIMQLGQENGILIDKFSFVPSVSSIDLDYNTPNYSMFMFNGNKDFLINNNYTPFDDIYADNTNDPHVAIEQDLIDQVVEREIMLEDFFLQNKTISSSVGIQALDEITIGENVDALDHVGKNIPVGPVVVLSGGELNLESQSIVFRPGVHIQKGARLTTSIPTLTANNARELTQSYHPNPRIAGTTVIRDNDDQQYEALISDQATFDWEISKGDQVYYESGNQITIDSRYEDGLYTINLESSFEDGVTTSYSKVILIDRDGSSLADTNTGLDQDLKMTIYPNPLDQDYIKVSFSNDIQSADIVIYNIKGQKVQFAKHTGLQSIMDLSNLETGIYFLEATGTDFQKVERLAINK